MRIPIALAVLAVTARTAQADAVLSGSDGQHFPNRIEVQICALAQVERTTMLFYFDPVAEEGDYVLTVPGPKGAYVVGVDLDRGSGFEPAAMVGEAPPPALGGSSSAQDPDVAAWLGTDPLRADFAGLEPGPLVVRVGFQRLLRRYRGEVVFEVGVRRSPLRDDSDAGPQVSTTVVISTFRQLVDLEVAGDGASIDQTSNRAEIHTERTLGLGQDAVLGIRYQEESSGIDVRFLTHRTPTSDPLGGQEGYFLLFVDADLADLDDAQPRTLSMVIDESGSMEGNKIVQARDAARAMLDHLGPEDAFNIISFDDSVRSFRSSPVLATTANRDAARSWISGIYAAGSTDLDSAIRTGLSGIGDGEPLRFDAMILLSDGMATAGETDDVRIHDNAVAHNHAHARIFTFSVGSDADTALMEALARSSRGRHFDLNDAQAASELAQRVRELFEDIRYVRLTDLELVLGGIGAGDTLPEQMQDLFSGGQAILVGRYSTPGSGTVTITGDENGKPFSRTVDVSAPTLREENAFIKWVWATEKVGTLIADMSRGGDLAELEARITELGLAYRIQTPFTSFSTSVPPGDVGGGGCPGCGGSGGGSASGGGWGGGGANGPLELAACLLLLGLAALLERRRRC